MKRVDLMAVQPIAVDKPHAGVNPLLVGISIGQQAKQLPEQPARNGAHPLVGLPDFGLAVLPAPETLNELQFLYLLGIALADLEVFLLRHAVAKVYHLVQEFRVRGEGHVLLLHRRVDECGMLCIGLASTSILAVFPLRLLFSVVAD